MEKSLFIIGYGNLGWHLEQLLYAHNLQIAGIFSSKFHSNPALVSPDKINENIKSGDYVFLTINDDRVVETAKLIQLYGGVPIICSGAIELSAIDNDNCIAFYPLYSFTKFMDVDWSKFPVFIECKNDEISLDFYELLRPLQLNLHNCRPNERLLLHIGGVFINNFTNSCASAAAHILTKNGLSIDFLMPILEQTLDKIIQSKEPKTVQTGPAIRNDSLTIAKHLNVLKNFPIESDVYRVMTNFIQQNKDSQ